MRTHKLYIIAMTGLVGALWVTAATMAGTSTEPSWQIVANNGDVIPGHPGRTYNSYNPPAVNFSGVVVFRARSAGHQKGPVSGIYVRDMSLEGTAITVIADRTSVVPEPNNTEYPAGQSGHGGEHGEGHETAAAGPDWRLATFNEFPSIPRIAMHRDAIATRGNHQPVWTYVTGRDPETGVYIETRTGATGIYIDLDVIQTSGEETVLTTGAGLLGTVSDGTPYDFRYLFGVPGATQTTRFDVFPGSPSITDGGHIAFKGNFTDQGTGKTGVFYRSISTDYAGGVHPIEMAASSDTPIPNPRPGCAPGTAFGSTAAPSAVTGDMVFVGLDDEDDPSCGGIYRAPFRQPSGSLETLVGLETPVPLEGAGHFERLGEALSYDGRFVAFWGAWGEATRTVRLYCPETGNRARRNFCNHAGDFDPTAGMAGDPNSVCDDTDDPLYPRCYQDKAVPVNQGIFVHDSITGELHLLAGAGGDFSGFSDFLYWKYSGAPPGAGHGEGNCEPPRFRSSAFLAVSGTGGSSFRLVFLARRGVTDQRYTHENPVDGVFLAEASRGAKTALLPLVETGSDGTLLDPAAVDGSGNVLPITSLGLERESFRGGWLAITASMGTEEDGWGGIYLADLRSRRPLD